MRRLTISRPLYNFIAVFAGNFVSKIFGLFLAIILARYLGPEDYGKYAFVVSFAYLFNVIADFGLNDLFVRDVARDRSIVSKYLALALIVKPSLSIISITILIFSVYFMNYSTEILVCSAIFSIHIIFITLISSITAIFRAYEQMEYASLINVLNGLLSLIFIIFVVFYEGTLYQILSFRVISFFVGFLIGLFIVIKLISKPDFSINISFIKVITKRALPFLTITIIDTLYFNIDIIMLSKMKGDIYVGWYTPAANDLFFGLLIIPSTIATVVYPMFTRQYGESIEKLRETINFSIKLLFILGVPVCFGTYILAQDIIHFIFGHEYGNSIVVLKIMALVIIFAFAREPLGFGLAAIGKEKVLMWLSNIFLLLNILLNLILIPIYAHIGAAITTVFCITLSFYLTCYYLNKEILEIVIYKNILKPVIASLVMSMMLYLLQDINLLFRICIGAVVYFILIFIMRTFTFNELEILKKSIIKKLDN